MPDGYQGEFGPNIKTLIISLYHKSKVTSSGIVEFLRDHGILIGAATVSRFLTERHAEDHALCWVHDGRHYKKPPVFIPLHKKKLKHFLTRYWTYYDKLLDYKLHPTTLDAEVLSKEFEDLFSTTTGYDQLDERIRKTKAKKKAVAACLSVSGASFA